MSSIVSSWMVKGGILSQKARTIYMIYERDAKNSKSLHLLKIIILSYNNNILILYSKFYKYIRKIFTFRTKRGVQADMRKSSEKSGTYSDLGKYDQNRVNGFGREQLEDFISFIRFAEGTRVLDYMCGDGNLTRLINEWHPQEASKMDFLGVDIAERQLKEGIAQPKPHHTHFLYVDVTNHLPFISGYIDQAVRKSASHELKAELHTAALKELYRVMAPEAKFIDIGFLFSNKQLRDEFDSK